MSKKHSYVPRGAVHEVKNTVIPSRSIVLDFCFYKDNKCEMDVVQNKGVLEKMLRFIKMVGQCKDGDELMSLLKANNSCDISNSKYSNWAPDDMKLYEVWHEKRCGERIFFSYSGNIFYPVVFLNRHEF